jgi:hypothetical protein
MAVWILKPIFPELPELPGTPPDLLDFFVVAILMNSQKVAMD